MQKKILLCFILLFFSTIFFSEDSLSKNDYLEKYNAVSSLFEQIVVYQFTKDESIFDEYSELLVKLSQISQNASWIYKTVLHQKDLSVKTVFDICFENKKAFLQTYSVYDVYSDDGKPFLEIQNYDENSFVVKEPDELQKAHDDLELFIQNTENLELDELLKNNNQAAVEDKQKIILNSEKNISLYSYKSENNTENLAIKNYDSKKMLISTYKNNLTRSYFNEKMVLLKRETWSLEGLSNSKKIKVESFEYDENFILTRTIVDEGENRHVLEYNENKLVSKIWNYSLFKDDALPVATENMPSSKKYILSSRTFFKYNMNNKVSEKIFIEYDYNKYRKNEVALKNTKREVYEYKVDDFTPDYFYYENDFLCLQTIYSSKEAYCTTSFFDSGFSVQSYYENGLKKRDLYILNGVLWRERKYD